MVSASRGSKASGFTLIELMITCGIIGLLAAVAVPSFIVYVRKAKTTEAVTNVSRIYQGALAYYNQELSNRDGSVAAFRLPGTTPAVPSFVPAGEKYTPTTTDWDDASWQALQFEVTTPIACQYQYCRLHTTNALDPCLHIMSEHSPPFEVFGLCDFDGDRADYTLVVRTSRHVEGSGNEISAGGLYVLDEGEVALQVQPEVADN